MSVVMATRSRGVLALPPVKSGLLLYTPLRKDSLAVSFDVAKHMETPTVETVDVDGTFIARKDPWYVTDATLNTLRCEHEGGLFEGQRINLCLRAEELATNPPWVPTNAIVTANDTTAPDGNNTADKVADNGAASEIHQIFAGGTLTNNLQYATSVFVKEGIAVEFTLTLRDDGAAADRARSDFEWVAGALTIKAQDVGTALVEKIGRAGWYRAAVICPAAVIIGANAHRILIYPTEDGGGAVGLYHHFWGVQLEQGLFPSSYIPTLAASVTRGVDLVQYTNAGLIHCTTTGTIMLCIAPLDTRLGDSGRVEIARCFRVGPFNGWIFFASSPNERYESEIYSAGAATGLLFGPNFSVGALDVIALVWATNNFRLYRNGGLDDSDLAGNAPTDMGITVDLGSGVDAYCNVAYMCSYDRVLTLAEIQLNEREFRQWLQS